MIAATAIALDAVVMPMRRFRVLRHSWSRVVTARSRLT